MTEVAMPGEASKVRVPEVAVLSSTTCAERLVAQLACVCRGWEMPLCRWCEGYGKLSFGGGAGFFTVACWACGGDGHDYESVLRRIREGAELAARDPVKELAGQRLYEQGNVDKLKDHYRSFANDPVYKHAVATVYARGDVDDVAEFYSSLSIFVEDVVVVDPGGSLRDRVLFATGTFYDWRGFLRYSRESGNPVTVEVCRSLGALSPACFEDALRG